MPDDPDKPVEQRLKAWARHRREQAGSPFELHPVTRKLLQDEVARTYPKKSEEPAAQPGGWFKMFWPRFAFAGALGVALVVLAGILLPSLAKSKSKAKQIAMVREQAKDLSPDVERRNAPAQFPPGGDRAAVAPVDHLGDEVLKAPDADARPASTPALAESKPVEQELQFKPEARHLTLKAAEQPAKSEARQDSEKSGRLELAFRDKQDLPSPGKQAGAAAGGLSPETRTPPKERYGLAPNGAGVALQNQRETDRLGTGNGYANYSGPTGQIGQQFLQPRRYRVNFNSPPMPNVLRSFEVAQNGQQIRVVDADGSVYDGAMEQARTPEGPKTQLATRSAASDLKKEATPEESGSLTADGETAKAQNTFFRVSGTNRTLNQLVVFQGNFLANTNQTNEIVIGGKLNMDQRTVAPGRSQQSQHLPNALIQGQATIGDSNRVQINAAPVLRSE